MTLPTYQTEAWFPLLVAASKVHQRKVVAELLGMSAATVSQVLNASGKYGSGGASTQRVADKVLHTFGRYVCPHLTAEGEMVLRPHVRTVSLGGVARPQSYEMTGPLASMVLDELWLDLLVLGVDGLSADGGASCEHDGEAGINAKMVQRAERVVIVAGADKIGRRAFARICAVDQVDVLVTDADAPRDEVAALEAAGVDVRIAGQQTSEMA